MEIIFAAQRLVKRRCQKGATLTHITCIGMLVHRLVFTRAAHSKTLSRNGRGEELLPPGPATGPNRSSPVPHAVHQRFLLSAVDFDHGAVDEMHQRRGQHRDEVGDFLDLGDAPHRDRRRRELVGLLVGELHVARHRGDSPAQRSVRTGPGLTAHRLMLCLPYWLASDIVRFCPAALAAPGAISQYECLTPSLPMRLTTRPPPWRTMIGST